MVTLLFILCLVLLPLCLGFYVGSLICSVLCALSGVANILLRKIENWLLSGVVVLFYVLSSVKRVDPQYVILAFVVTHLLRG